jgi:hypothetical protein
MSLDNALQEMITSVPECVAAGYVDLPSGMILGIKTVDSHPTEVVDIIAAATADLFQGPNVITIEKLFKKARGVNDDGSHYFQEMIINSDNLIHIFLRARSNSEQVLCIVTRKSANLGMVLSKTRAGLATIEKAA